MELEGYDHETFQNSLYEAFKEPVSKLASKETMFVGGNLAKLQNRISKASAYLNELVKEIEPITQEYLLSADPSKINDYIEGILRRSVVPPDLFD